MSHYVIEEFVIFDRPHSGQVTFLSIFSRINPAPQSGAGHKIPPFCKTYSSVAKFL